MTDTSECERCDKTFEYDCPWKPSLCPECSEEKAMASLSNIEPPEGGWPRGSDMDRI